MKKILFAVLFIAVNAQAAEEMIARNAVCGGIARSTVQMVQKMESEAQAGASKDRINQMIGALESRQEMINSDLCDGIAVARVSGRDYNASELIAITSLAFKIRLIDGREVSLRK
jgi:hypothetical protein